MQAGALCAAAVAGLRPATTLPHHQPLCQGSLTGLTAWQLGRAAFVLLMGISWSVDLLLATFLLLPPAQHLAVQALSLAILFANNHPVCQHFLEQHTSNGAVVDALDAGLRTLVVSAAPWHKRR